MHVKHHEAFMTCLFNAAMTFWIVVDSKQAAQRSLINAIVPTDQC